MALSAGLLNQPSLRARGARTLPRSGCQRRGLSEGLVPRPRTPRPPPFTMATQRHRTLRTHSSAWRRGISGGAYSGATLALTSNPNRAGPRASKWQQTRGRIVSCACQCEEIGSSAVCI